MTEAQNPLSGVNRREISDSEIESRFSSHTVAPHIQEQIKEIRWRYIELSTLLDTVLPWSREASIALTELEASSMWAIKALSKTG